MIEPDVLINGGRNTIVYERDDGVRDAIFKLFATNHSPQSGASSLRDLLCCLPRVSAPSGLTYENLFRVLIMQFIDAYSFDVRSAKKTCVHIVRHTTRWRNGSRNLGWPDPTTMSQVQEFTHLVPAPDVASLMWRPNWTLRPLN